VPFFSLPSIAPSLSKTFGLQELNKLIHSFFPDLGTKAAMPHFGINKKRDYMGHFKNSIH